MAEIYMNVDAALSEVPVNLTPLVDDTDGKTIEACTYNQAGLALYWNFVTVAGAFSHTAVTPTDTGGNYDWVSQGQGMFTIEIPASGGASINNDTEGFGWFSGVATGILPWRGPVIGFRAAAVNNAMTLGTGVGLPISSQVKRNTAISTPTRFVMVDTDGNLATGKTVTVTRMLDSDTSYGAGTLGAVSEIGSTGTYSLASIGAGDVDAVEVMFKASASGCRDFYWKLYTQP